MLCGIVHAQAQELSLGYLGQVVVQPGVELNADFVLQDTLLGQPKLQLRFGGGAGYFAQVDVHRSFLADGYVGIARHGKKLAHRLSLRAGYLRESELLEGSVNLGSGSIVNERREQHSFFLTQCGYRMSGRLSPILGWYGRFSYGLRFSGREQRRAMVFAGVGLTFKIDGL